MGNNIDVYTLRNSLIVKRTIAERLNESFPCKLLRMISFRSVNAEILLRTVYNVPHVQKHICETPCRFAVRHNSCVLPITVRMRDVHIFVRKIYTARKCRVTIDDQYFTMIAVVHNRTDKRNKRIEHSAFYSHCVQLQIISCGKFAHGADVVIYHAHLNTDLCFLGKNLQNRIPYLALLYNEIFKKYKMFCSRYFFDNMREHLFSGRIESRFRIAVNRISCAQKIRSARSVAPLHLLKHRFILFHILLLQSLYKNLFRFFKFLAQISAGALIAV